MLGMACVAVRRENAQPFFMQADHRSGYRRFFYHPSLGKQGSIRIGTKRVSSSHASTGGDRGNRR